MRDDVISSTIQLISESTEHHQYIAVQFWQALSEDTTDKQPLTQVAVWAIGEYGDVLLNVSHNDVGELVEKPTESDVIDVYQKLLWSPQNTATTKQYTLMSLTKLSTRFKTVNE